MSNVVRTFAGRTRNFVGESFWARGYFVSTVGRDEQVIREYIRSKESEVQRQQRAWLLAKGSRSEAYTYCSMRFVCHFRSTRMFCATADGGRIQRDSGNQQRGDRCGSLRGQNAAESYATFKGRAAGEVGIDSYRRGRTTGRCRDELPAQAQGEGRWRRERRGSSRLVAAMEKARALSVDFMEVGVN